MLEECTDLTACEITLLEAKKSIRLLGEIPLSDRDIEILANFVHQKITPSISRGTAYLKTKTPTCFVCFLVSMGRFYDKHAGYWPIVEEKVGQIDMNWQVKWGKIFIQYLEDNDLPRFDEEEGLAYVTPILGHTCIPDCCLDEYSDRVLVPLINRDLLNPLDKQEIIHDLRVRRKINESRLELEKKKKVHEEWLKAPQQENRELKNQLKKYEEITSLLAEEEECNRRKIELHGLDNAELTRLNLLSCINEASESIQRLESEGKRLWGEIAVFKNRYQPILEVKPQIDAVIRYHVRLNEELPEAIENEKKILTIVNTEWAKISREPWNDSFGVEIPQFPLEQLINQIEQYQCLQGKQKTIQEKIGNLEASQKEVKKPPTLFLSLLIFIRKTLIWIHGKKSVPQSGEIQQLQVASREVEVQLQLQQDSIKGLCGRLPVEERLLDNPTPDMHEVLYSLKSMYERYVDARDKRIKLEEEEGQLAGQVRDLASSLDVAVDGNINAWVNRLFDELKEAQQNQAAALEAKRILEKEIRPTLEAARLEYQNWQTDLKKLDKQLAELGGGSTQRGLKLVQEFHQSQAACAKTRQDLSLRCSDFISIESKMLSQGWDTIRRVLEEAISEVENRIQSAKSELKLIDRGFDNRPAQYFGVDEPIRRFLLYGGITAENCLTDSILLFARVESGEKVEDISDLHLPIRIIQHFQPWWEYYRMRVDLKPVLEEETNLETGERFRTPQIYFDTSTCEIIAKLPSQRFLRHDHGITAQLEVFSVVSSTPIYATSLKLFNCSRGLVDTRSIDDIVITIPSEKYDFLLKSKENLIQEWEIPGPSDGVPFLAFSAISDKLIKGEQLPRLPLIIVVNKRLRIHPQECVLTEGGFLFWGWKEYAWYEVDLSRIEEFCLSSDDGQSLTIPLTSEHSSGIDLIGGNQLVGVLSDERSVFDIPPEFIRMPKCERDELGLVRVSLFWEDENHNRKSKHYQVDELENLINERDKYWIDIPLNVEQFLGANPLGPFTLRIYRPPYLDWQLSFCIVPQLNASFDQEMYLPYRETIPDVIATLSLPEMSTFKPDSPAKLVSSDGTSCTVQTPASENRITGMLLCSTVNRERIDLPITFSIPKLRWRLQGLDDPQYDKWFDQVQEELWIGDWIAAQEVFLVIEIPWFYTGNISLGLPGNSVSLDFGIVQNRKVRVDLKALEDTLRAGPSLETITISLKDTQTKIPDIPLFTVRTCWLAEKIRCFHYPIGGTVQLDVSWKEKGKANQKVTRLWYLSGDQPRLIQEQLVSKDVQETTFITTSTQIKSGKYLVHLEPYDPWSSRPVCHKLNDQNTAIIEIVTKAPEKAALIRFVSVDEQHSFLLPQGSYRIHIIGKVINQKLPDTLDIEDYNHVLITPINENWFVGNLEVKGISEVIKHLSDTNPVKFEYDTQTRIVTSIEDRHGEGAMYCFTCNMLFWSQETNLKHEHKTYGPIEKFMVVWESE